MNNRGVIFSLKTNKQGIMQVMLLTCVQGFPKWQQVFTWFYFYTMHG